MEKIIEKLKGAHDSAATKKCIVWVTVAIATAYVATNGTVQLTIGG